MTPNPPELPTPRTDAFFAKMRGFPHEMLDQMTEHARTLERETSDLRAALEELIPAQDDYDTCAGALENALSDPDKPGSEMKKVREYYRNAKIRLMKAREAARKSLTPEPATGGAVK